MTMGKIDYRQIDCRIIRVTERAVLVEQEDYGEKAWIPRVLLSAKSDANLEIGEIQTLSVQAFKLEALGWLP